MKVSLSWLKELVHTKLDIDDIAEKLSKSGFEVEEIVDLAQNDYNLSVIMAHTSSDLIQQSFHNYSILDPNWDNPNATNKVRIRSYLDEDLANRHRVHHGRLTKLNPQEISGDDKRFSLEASIVGALIASSINYFWCNVNK